MTNAGGGSGPTNQDITVQVTDGNGKGVNSIQIEASVSSETGCDVDISSPNPAVDTTPGSGANSGKATFTIAAVSGQGTAKVRFLMRIDERDEYVDVDIKVNR